MSKHITISPGEAADRLAIRELVAAYAHCADRRDAKGQMSLFTADTHFVVYMNAKNPHVAAGVWPGNEWGREERSRKPSTPSARKRSTHLATVFAVMLN